MNCRPVNAKEIARRSFEQAYHIEDVLAMSLVDAVNAGIQEQVSHGHLVYAFSIPPFIYGYPCYDAQYIARKVRDAYMQQGFHVHGERLDVRLSWDRDDPHACQTRPPPPPLPASAAPVLQITAQPPHPPPLLAAVKRAQPRSPSPPPPSPSPSPSPPPPPPPRSPTPVLRTITLDPLGFSTWSKGSTGSGSSRARGAAAGRGKP